jgi:oligogalacturonide lyase
MTTFFTMIAVCASAWSVPPDEWIDAATGHKVQWLSRREGNNEVFYYHQNIFTAVGDKMVFAGSTPLGRCAFTLTLDTLEIEQITTDGGLAFEVVAPKRRELFYMRGDTVFATHVDTGVTRTIANVPEPYHFGRGLSINADETQLLGCYALGEQGYSNKPREQFIAETFEAKLPNALYAIGIESGRVHEFHHENVWFGHAQFSPTDPSLVEFCHEGPERRLDRMWLIRTDGSGLTKARERTVVDEFVTHEFWQPDGSGLWFDLQLPCRAYQGRKTLFSYIFPPAAFLAFRDIAAGSEQRYRLKRSQISWHYNVAPGGQLLCGDGEGRFFELGPSGKWINLYRPRDGKIDVERLCSLRDHSYQAAPNARFTPDGRWVVFQSDMHGDMQVYAVSVEK